MLCFQAQGYVRACSPTTGGIAQLWVGDANDFNFIPGALDTNGDPTGYAGIEYRSGAEGSESAVAPTATITVTALGSNGDTITWDPVVGETVSVSQTSSESTTALLAAKIAAAIDGTDDYSASASDSTITVTGPTTFGALYNGTAPGLIYDDSNDMAITIGNWTGGVTATDAGKLYEITSVDDTIGVEINQTLTDGSSSWEYVITARMAQMSQQMTNFNIKLDGSGACCDALFVWQNNDGSIWVAGEKYVGGVRQRKFKLRQDGSKIQSGKTFTEFNGQDLSLKGNYWRPPFQFIGGMEALQSFIAE